MRQLHDHEVNPANRQLTITATDSPGSGGANHEYEIELAEPGLGGRHVLGLLSFQNGPIDVDGNGVNGITHEALLAVVCDRLRSFQSGPYACRENAIALTKLEEAMHWLHHRTLARQRRGVEGTHAV